VELLLRYGRGSPPVRTQLCLAIAALVAHLPADHWGPGGSVQWLVQRLSMEPGPAALPCLLELLTVLPQVCTTAELIV
jgi:transportin-3